MWLGEVAEDGPNCVALRQHQALGDILYFIPPQAWKIIPSSYSLTGTECGLKMASYALIKLTLQYTRETCVPSVAIATVQTPLTYDMDRCVNLYGAGYMVIYIDLSCDIIFHVSPPSPDIPLPHHLYTLKTKT